MLTKIKNLFSQHKPRGSSNKKCCIEITSEEFLIAYAHYGKNKKELILCESFSYKNNTDLFSSIANIIKNNQLDNVNCSWVLRPDQYQLLLMDALAVPPNEFQAAIRWKIKDLVSYPFDDLVVDSFPLPIKKATASEDMIMVVVSKASDLMATCGQLQQCGLLLNTIDIQELCLRNLSVFYEKEDQATAFIYIQEKNSQLVITVKKQLQFARRFDLGMTFLGSFSNEQEITQKMDRLALEIQRSFDYYQSQWRQSIPAQIILATVKDVSKDLEGLLSQRLSIPIKMCRLADYFNDKKQLGIANQGKYLSVIGGLLRDEVKGDAATN